MAKKKKSSKASEAARTLAKLGASKGGKARNFTLTKEERSEIARKAVWARWKKEKGEDYRPPRPREKLPQEGNKTVDSKPTKDKGELPYSMFSGEATIGKTTLECHVLNDFKRVLTQRKMIASLNMARGSRPGMGGDRLANFVTGKLISPFIPSKLRGAITCPIRFLTDQRKPAYGYEAMILADLCESVLQARDAGVLQSQQEDIAKQCEILLRSFAKIGIIALIDEATGYQKVRAKRALQVKLQAFIAEEMQEWARMFPEEFWLELARLEGTHYSPRSRPLRWGKYVMAFVYDAIDKDVGEKLREINPDPHHGKNHHQWLKQFGRQRVDRQIHRVIGMMEACQSIEEFKRKFARVFKNMPIQSDFEDIDWGLSP